MTILSRTGQNVTVNLTEALGTASLTIGSLTSTTVRPDLIFVNRVSTPGNVTLTANQTITEATGDVGNDIVANQLMLDAGQTIGTGGNPIETQVLQLEAETVNGGIFLGNVGDLTIGGATAELRGLFTGSTGSTANIMLTNSGSIALFDSTGSQSVTSAGNVTLTALGATANIISTVNFNAIQATGDINLSAGQDVLFGAIGTDWDNDVRAGGAISVTAGRDFQIDGDADMAANDLGTGSNGGISILAGRDILIEDDHGGGATVVVTDGTGNIVLTTGADDTFSLAANSATALFADDGNVTVNADRVLIEADSGITTAGSGSIRFTGATAGRDIVLGSATDAARRGGVFRRRARPAVHPEHDHRQRRRRLCRGAGRDHPSERQSDPGSRPRSPRPGKPHNAHEPHIARRHAVTNSAAGPITTGTLYVFVDTPNTDALGGISGFDGTVTVTSSTITGNTDIDLLRGTNDDDTVSAGDSGDVILLDQAGNDTAMGGAGVDIIGFGATFTGVDIVDGGADRDTVTLQGDYATVPLVLTATSLVDVERILLAGGFFYDITTVDENVAAGEVARRQRQSARLARHLVVRRQRRERRPLPADRRRRLRRADRRRRRGHLDRRRRRQQSRRRRR